MQVIVFFLCIEIDLAKGVDVIDGSGLGIGYEAWGELTSLLVALGDPVSFSFKVGALK